jgi:hypothetical protein
MFAVYCGSVKIYQTTRRNIPEDSHLEYEDICPFGCCALRAVSTSETLVSF